MTVLMLHTLFRAPSPRSAKRALSRAQRFLVPDEQLVTYSPFYAAFYTLRVAGTLVTAACLVIARMALDGMPGVLAVAAGLATISLLWLTPLTVVVVTDKRFLITRGIVTLSYDAVRVARVRQVSYASRRLLGRVGYGRLTVDLGDETIAVRLPRSAIDIGPGTRPVLNWAERMTSVLLYLAGSIAAPMLPGWEAEVTTARTEQSKTGSQLAWFTVGLVKAALIYRTVRIASPLTAWLDSVACSDARTFKAIGWIGTVTAGYVFLHGGLLGVIADAEGIATICGALFAAARWRRKVLQDRDR